MVREDPSVLQACALVPEVLREADRRCVAAFGRVPLVPGAVVWREGHGYGTVLGPWRAGRGVMVAVDHGGDTYACHWPEDCVSEGPDADTAESRAGLHGPRLYPLGASSVMFWHEGCEFLIWRHAKGAQSWDVVRKMPGGTRVDARCYVARRVGGAIGDAWLVGLSMVAEARHVVPSPHVS